MDEYAINIIFDGGPGPQGGRLVEVENDEGFSIPIGTWSQRDDGLWALRITPDDLKPMPDITK